jgi:hypothetical protein
MERRIEKVTDRNDYPGDPLEALRELRDDLAYDDDKTFLNSANDALEAWSAERASLKRALSKVGAVMEHALNGNPFVKGSVELKEARELLKEHLQ